MTCITPWFLVDIQTMTEQEQALQFILNSVFNQPTEPTALRFERVCTCKGKRSKYFQTLQEIVRSEEGKYYRYEWDKSLGEAGNYVPEDASEIREVELVETLTTKYKEKKND